MAEWPTCGLAAPEEQPRCWDCGDMFEYGTGYGESQVFCTELCADSYRHSLGA